MKVGILTSSRADFGIYLPLATQLENDSFFELEIIAFGTHISHAHGYTISEIESYGFKTVHTLDTVPESDSPKGISKSMGNTMTLFSEFWSNHTYNLVFCLGDRYEMFAAVSAATPFNVNIAHLHGGETTLGAIDNAYRHSLSLFSSQIFVSTDAYKKRAEQVVEPHVKVHNVGALSVDNLSKIKFLTKTEIQTRFNINLDKPTILSTFHPETVNLEGNKTYIQELIKAFDVLQSDYQILITLPNTDPMGQMVRDHLLEFGKKNPEVIIVESLGMLGYLSCMKHCAFLVGNTSSGFVEATYFPKYVINLGQRQQGRLETENIKTISIESSEIVKTVKYIEKLPPLDNLNIYGDGFTAEKIINILKTEHEK